MVVRKIYSISSLRNFAKTDTLVVDLGGGAPYLAPCSHEDHLVRQDLGTVAETIRAYMKHLESKKRCQGQGLTGHAIGLKSAYKQLASNREDAWASTLGVWDPDVCDVVYYRFATLPFGSSRSVTAFNRVASALRKF